MPQSITSMTGIEGARECAGKTGKEQGVKVHYDEGVAIRIGPEPCASTREGTGEASAGVCAGQPLSRESPTSRKTGNLQIPRVRFHLRTLAQG